MNLPMIKKAQSLKLLFLITILSVLSGCVKRDDIPPRATEESADVVYAWYKFIARIQLRVDPQPVA